jgi:hypothetical protein
MTELSSPESCSISSTSVTWTLAMFFSHCWQIMALAQNGQDHEIPAESLFWFEL